MKRLSILVLLAAALTCLSAARAGDIREESFKLAGLTRSFHWATPETSDPAPVVLLLHGSHGDSLAMVREWLELAKREGVIVVAPQARKRDAWHIRADGPQFIREVLAAVESRRAIDRRRIFLFGHSGGAVYALTLSMIQSELFAATAVYGGAWRTQKERSAVSYAKRKIPIALFIGANDELFPQFTVQQTQSALEQAGHVVSATVLPRQTHDYAKVAAEVNRMAWDFFQRHALPEAAVARASTTR